MIPRTESLWQTPAWQTALARAISSLEELCEYLQIDAGQLPISAAAGEQFSLKVPLHYLELIEKGNPSDPLLLQVLPTALELRSVDGFVTDPVADLHSQPTPGVIHKYHGRVLLITTGACAIHCRYCFRRHFPYAEANARTHDWSAALEYIGSRADITELILSGGDPLTLSDENLGRLIKSAEEIAHLERIRIHTRIPTLLPERITESLIRLLAESRLKSVVVLHVNHPRELTSVITASLRELHYAGIYLLNQSVMLKGVNDNADILSELSVKLFDAGVTPYYLNLLDPVAGSAHFHVADQRAMAIHKRLAGRLPGYLVPRLVRDEPGKEAKSSSIQP